MLRSWRVLQNNLVLSTKLIKHIGHRKVFKVDVSSVSSPSEQRSVLTVYHISSIISSFGGGEGGGKEGTKSRGVLTKLEQQEDKSQSHVNRTNVGQVLLLDQKPFVSSILNM